MTLKNILFVIFCYIFGIGLAQIISKIFPGLEVIEFLILTVICAVFFFIIGLFVYDKIPG